ncbi:xylulokinase [Bacilliculturomica massiliensis]|uniref:xylulokinase n=1 Tax=Bacilliculturomica massiliensis TaxID=1917867 RepID=UPI00102FFB4E|nr:FGGY family carbohydrate kinase [Bacilliculturomica massiliensis]
MQKNRDYFITYDFGTGSVKAALIDESFKLEDVCCVPYSIISERPGWAVQRVEDYWDGFRKATETLLSRSGVDSRRVKGVAMSQTTADVIFVDARGEPLDDCVIWLDGRAEKQAAEINARAGRSLYQGKNVPPKVVWYQQNRPEIYGKARYLLDVSAYLYRKLTGEYAYDLSGAFGSQLLDEDTLEWSGEKLRLSGIPPSLLPERLVGSTEIVGQITAEAAAETGLFEGTPVFGGCSDNANGQVGSGCIRSGDVHLYLGSSAWFEVTTTDTEPERGNYPSAVPGMRYHFRCTDTAGSGVDALLRMLYPQESARMGDRIYELLDEELKRAGEKTSDVLFLPYLFGEQDPVADTEVRGTILNVTDSTKRCHVLRAFVEGIAFNLLWMKEQQIRRTGRWTEKSIRAFGGGSQSRGIMQIAADVMGDTLVRLENPRTAGNIGLAVCAAVGLGMARDFSVLDGIVKEERSFVPDASAREAYDRKYQIFKTAYGALRETYERLNGGG